jgi:hypothetical protein
MHLTPQEVTPIPAGRYQDYMSDLLKKVIDEIGRSVPTRTLLACGISDR